MFSTGEAMGRVLDGQGVTPKTTKTTWNGTLAPYEAYIRLNLETGTTVGTILTDGDPRPGRRLTIEVLAGSGTLTLTHTALASQASGKIFANNSGSNRTVAASATVTLMQLGTGTWIETGYLAQS